METPLPSSLPCPLRPQPRVLVQAYGYDADGDTNPFRYCGEYLDAETDTYYLRARNYNPSTGRFLAEDTHWNPGNMIYDADGNISRTAMMQSTNLYVYCGSNPISFADPSGQHYADALGRAEGSVNDHIKVANNDFSNIESIEIVSVDSNGVNVVAVSAYGAFLIRIEAQVWIVEDDKYTGFMIFGGGGVGTPNVGASGTAFKVKGADTIFDLEGGASLAAGGSMGYVGGDFTVDLDDISSLSGNVNGGWRLLPAEGHAVFTTGKIIYYCEKSSS